MHDLQPQRQVSANVLLSWFERGGVMTLFDCAGVYVGWDRSGHPHLAIRIYHRSWQVQVGLLLLGCDWFFKQTDARVNQSTSQGAD